MCKTASFHSVDHKLIIMCQPVIRLLLILFITVLIFFLAVIVSFENTTYSVIESAGPAQPVLVLSNPSSTPITVRVFNTDGSATGEY